LLALILLGLASVGLAVAGCLGPAGIGLQPIALTLAASGLVVLALWIAICRDCLLIRFLQRFFGAMALVMAALAAALALIGMFPCSAGAAAVAALFGVMVGALSIGVAILKCP
jgi:hypothetical protein